MWNMGTWLMTHVEATVSFWRMPTVAFWNAKGDVRNYPPNWMESKIFKNESSPESGMLWDVLC